MVHRKVLVVSSDSVLRGLLQQNLTEAGYRLANTRDWNGQLRATLDWERPDVILVDVMMPAMDGIEVSLRIRQLCQTPIILLSAWGAGRDKVRRLDLAAEDYLTEPFGIPELIDQIEESLHRNAALVRA